jgi:hypothetical protein
MSMHMIQGLRVTNKSKTKKKPGWKKREEEHRKWLIKMGIDPDEKPSKKKEFVEYVPTKSNVRETKHYPSLTSDTIPGVCAKKESQKYTGDLIVGIATMHKSNAVPVMRDTEQAKEISQMRR